MKKLINVLIAFASISFASYAQAGGRCLFYLSNACGVTPAGWVWDDAYSTTQSPTTCQIRAVSMRNQCYGARDNLYVNGYYNKSGDGANFTAVFVAVKRSGVNQVDVYVRGHAERDDYITTFNVNP